MMKLRHIDDNLMLALWLLVKAGHAGKSAIRLENDFLHAWFGQSRVSQKKVDLLVEDIKHIFPIHRLHHTHKHQTVLDLCTHAFQEEFWGALHIVYEVPSLEQMEAELGIQWKQILISDYDPRSESN